MIKRFFNAILGFHSENQLTHAELEVQRALGASTILLKLIGLALEDNKFLMTEGVLRISANEVKKNKALHNIDDYIHHYSKEPDHALLGTLLKIYLKMAITNEQKHHILAELGLDNKELEIGFLPKKQFEKQKEKLKKSPPDFTLDTPQLSHFIYLCQQICANDVLNKMTPNNIAICITPCLVPDFSEQVTRVFEKNIALLLVIVLEHWIKTANTKIENTRAHPFELPVSDLDSP